MPKELQIELVWNREFNWCLYKGIQDNLDTAIEYAKDIRDSGDGARVKKIRVIDTDTDEVLWSG